MTQLIYLIVHPRSNREQITVVDLQFDLTYQKTDWCLASQCEWQDRDEAIAVARSTALKHNLTYVLFESRYNHEENEDLYIVDADRV